MTQPAGDDSAAGRQDSVPAREAGQPRTVSKELAAEARASKRTFRWTCPASPMRPSSTLSARRWRTCPADCAVHQPRLRVAGSSHRRADREDNRFDVVLPDGKVVRARAGSVSRTQPTGEWQICPLVLRCQPSNGPNFLVGGAKESRSERRRTRQKRFPACPSPERCTVIGT